MSKKLSKSKPSIRLKVSKTDRKSSKSDKLSKSTESSENSENSNEDNSDSLFPLYHKLRKITETDYDEESFDLLSICGTISNFSGDNKIHCNMIQLLILEHFRFETGKNHVLPYKGNFIIEDKGGKYKITDLPLLLQRIICVYVTKALEKSSQ